MRMSDAMGTAGDKERARGCGVALTIGSLSMRRQVGESVWLRSGKRELGSWESWKYKNRRK